MLESPEEEFSLNVSLQDHSQRTHCSRVVEQRRMAFECDGIVQVDDDTAIGLIIASQ